MSEEFDLSTLLSATTCLVGPPPSKSSSNVKSVLLSRLSQYHSCLGSTPTVSESNTLEDVELTTAKEALHIIEGIQRILEGERLPDDAANDVSTKITNSSTQAPLIGTRDLAGLRTLLSIVFKWGVDPPLSQLTLSWSSKLSVSEHRFIDLTSTPQNYQLLSSFVSRLMALVFPDGLRGPISQTLITATILNRHIVDLLKLCISLGWLPKSLASDLLPPLDTVRPLTMRLLAILPPSQTITALGIILSSTPSVPAHVQKSCTSLLSRQLLRPDGIQGLLAAVFGEEESSDDDVTLVKLERTVRVLIAVPASMKPEDYFGTIIPRIVMLLSDTVPTAHRRAAAFAISRMLGTDHNFPYRVMTTTTVLRILHLPFLQGPSQTSNQRVFSDDPTSELCRLTPTAALSTLVTLITNADPSPIIISTLLSPISPALYALLYHLDKVKTSDPSLRVTLDGLLITWGRVVSSSEGVDVLWTILAGTGGDWHVDIDGQISRSDESKGSPPLSLLTSNHIDEMRELDLDSNILNLYPDPVHFVQFLKSIDRSDISSEIFVRLLESYRNMKSHQENDPMRTLLYIQLVIQMQARLSDGHTASNILAKPIHILSFVKHVLESGTSPSPGSHEDRPGNGQSIETLRVVVDEAGDLSDEGDSDDDISGPEALPRDGEMTETAINLLLSILEANQDLSARTEPVLDSIFSLLELLVDSASTSIRSLAQEARMVMTARLAPTFVRQKSGLNERGEDDVQHIYQKALKLLQDPILPVRAHGLLLLRQIVTPRSVQGSNKPQILDSALIPAILSIFLQSIQDDDSYIFLNAVQGLACMVDTHGKNVLKSLINEYVKGTDSLAGVDMTQRDLDTKIRVGEALSLVIRRCGTALGSYVDIVVPPLFKIVRNAHIPTALRTSSLSLLAECEGTYSLSLWPYIIDLFEAMIDLLRTESVTASHQPKAYSQSTDGKEGATPTMNATPTSTNSKFPPFRRAALHFLALLIKETTKQIYDSAFTAPPLPNVQMNRAKVTFAYLANTDEDMVVRVMAREAEENLMQLRDAMLGI